MNQSINRIILIASLVLITSPASAQVDYEQPPIDYLNAHVDDPVAKLSRRLEAGEVELKHDPRFGYLVSVLEALAVPTTSQTLVFSKTSLQLQRISPRRPRALYFNDEVYVGFCQQGDVLEFAATDARQGATFYTLSQDKEAPPKFVRDRGNCLSCHASGRTQNVPGYLVRSVFPDVAGRPLLGSGTFTTDHTSDFKDRWGGWYVSGEHGDMRHMGNVLCRSSEAIIDRDAGANKASLADCFHLDSYVSPHSDIVALMVLEHQTQMHNAITAANYETRHATFQSRQINELLDRPKGYLSDSAERRISNSADRVLKYLLFCNEFTLAGRVSGPTSFAEEFASRGERDAKGRSLRDFDLNTRLFKYPCSYLIYSPSFRALPDDVRGVILTRLSDILEGRDQSAQYAHLSPEIRQAILEILQETLPTGHSLPNTGT